MTKRTIVLRADHEKGLHRSATKADLENQFSYLLSMFSSLPKPERQLLFYPKRRWRFDFSWEPVKVAVEIQGGIFVHGGHNRGMGYHKDCDKTNAAAELGWLVLRYTTLHLNEMPAQMLENLEKTLKGRGLLW